MPVKAKPKAKKPVLPPIPADVAITVVAAEGNTPTPLNPKQELFCQMYVSRDFLGNGTEAYIEAYNPKKKGSWYNTAKTNASRLLTNANILARIDKLLELAGMTDQFADRQLLFWMTQKAEGSVAVKAIAEYNKLKKRVSNSLIGDMPDNVAAIQVIYRPKKIPGTAYAKYLED